jgi:Xaa-Pro aminopeptidase
MPSVVCFVSGRWVQREVYDVVLDVMKDCFKMCKPGVTLSQIHQHSVR